MTELEELAQGARELGKQAIIFRTKIIAYETRKDKKAMLRYITRAADEIRKLDAHLNTRIGIKLGEPAVSGVGFTTTPYQTLLVPAEDLLKTEGF